MAIRIVRNFLFCLALSGAAARADYLSEGNAAYLAGEYDKAVSIYEKADSKDDFLTRKFNAGVALLKKGDRSGALRRFEEVSVEAYGELKRAALFNIGYVHFQEGREIVRKAEEAVSSGGAQDLDSLITRLSEAAKAYRSALAALRRIDKPGEAARRAVAVTKTALVAVLDRISRLVEEKRKRREEELLKNPPQLLKELIEREKRNRRLSRSLIDEPERVKRLACRRLKKAEAENRSLAEKLLNYVKNPPGAGSKQQPQGTQSPTSLSEHKRKEAVTKLAEVLKEQREAEAAYARRSPREASPHHSRAIEALRAVRALFPLDVQALVKEGIETQEAVLAATEDLDSAGERGRTSSKGTQAGSFILELLSDNVLKPIARLLSPQMRRTVQELREEEEEVAWIGGVLSQATVQIPESASGPQAQKPQAGKENAEAKKIAETIRREGGVCRKAAQEAADLLKKAALTAALKPQKEALNALKKIAELFPKPPKSLEERLRELIERQQKAQDAAEGLRSLAEQAPAAKELAGSQRTDGKEAEKIAKELEARRQEKALKAADKVKEGAEHIYASAEALERVKAQAAVDSIEEAVKALREALALLTGKQGRQQQAEKERSGRQEKKGKGERKQKKKKQKTSYTLTPRLARLKREEMDRRRREQEARLLVAPSEIVVDKDW